MPSSSARCSQLPRAVDKVPFYEALKKFRDHLCGRLPDLQDSEITFPDLQLKTAVKKEPKEENGELYPGEQDSQGSQSSQGTLTSMGSQGSLDAAMAGDQYLAGLDQQLAQFTPGSFNVTPHNPMASYQQMQNLPMCSTQSSQGSTSVSHTLSQQQQDNVNGSQFQVKIKEEPLDPDAGGQGCSGRSDTISLGQFEVYSQPSTTASDAHLNSFLNGLYGLVNQVAAPQSGQYNYGLVSHSAITSGAPLQFNDALQDIVREGSEEADEEDSGMPSSSIANHSQPKIKEEDTTNTNVKGKGKGAKTSKPRKRKSKTSEELQEQSSPPPMMQGSQRPSSGSPHSMAQAAPGKPYPGVTTTQAMPITPYPPPGSFQPYTSDMTSFMPPMPSYTDAFSSQLQAMPGLHMQPPGQYMGYPGHVPNPYLHFDPRGYPGLPNMGQQFPGMGRPAGAGNMSNAHISGQEHLSKNGQHWHKRYTVHNIRT